MKVKTIYVVYENDEIIAHGSIKECAKQLGVSPRSIVYYGSKQTRAKAKKGLTRRIAEKVKQNEIGEPK